MLIPVLTGLDGTFLNKTCNEVFIVVTDNLCMQVLEGLK